MSRLRAAVRIAPVAMFVTIAAACGGGNAAEVKLLGTPIPSVQVTATATPACAPEAPLPLPASFPSDVTTPPDYKVSKIETSPHLIVTGVTLPPPDPKTTLAPHAVTGESQGRALQRENWTLTINPDAPGIDYSFSKPDGRTGRYNSRPVPGCAGYVTLTYELDWLTTTEAIATPTVTP